MTRLLRRTRWVTSDRGTMIHLPGVCFRLRALARMPIDLSKLRTPSIGEDSSLVRSIEGTRSAAHTRARMPMNAYPRRTPLTWRRTRCDVRDRFHGERNTPNSGFKHLGRPDGKGLHQFPPRYELGQEIAEFLAEILAVDCHLDGRAQVVDLLADVVARAFEDVAVHSLRARE